MCPPCPSPPPSSFSPVGELLWARPIAGKPPFIRRRKPRGRKAQGVKYERDAHMHFREQFGAEYIYSQWFQFQEPDNKVRWCELDGLLLRPKLGLVTILEMKYQHTSDAWWQLNYLYRPILRHLLPSGLWDISVCEVVKWYDPATAFPEAVRRVSDVRDVQPEEFGVHIWKP